MEFVSGTQIIRNHTVHRSRKFKQLVRNVYLTTKVLSQYCTVLRTLNETTVPNTVRYEENYHHRVIIIIPIDINPLLLLFIKK